MGITIFITIIFIILGIWVCYLCQWNRRTFGIKEAVPIIIILTVALAGIWQVQIKYSEIIDVKENLRESSKTTIKYLSYVVARFGRFGGRKKGEALKIEKEVREKGAACLKQQGCSEEEINNALAMLDKWIEFDEERIKQ